MKKIITTICSVLLACIFLLAGCGESAAPPPEGGPTGGTTENNNPQEKSPALRLRSEKTQALKVGEGMTIVWSTANTELGVTFASSDPSVVTVDSYGSVDAVGTGEADVTVTLVEDTTVSETIHYTITRTFFKQENGYKNGTIDFTNAETGGTVTIKDGQAQLLVNSEGQAWYFKCHLKRTGYTNGDMWGRWGVGSFLVNSGTPIGEVMMWAGLLNKDENATNATPYYGGWRTTTSGQEEDVEFSQTVYKIDGEVDVTIIRLGIRHYVIFECGEHTVKGTVDIPRFEGVDTFPGVYGQNQIVEVSNYRSSNDRDEVLAMLENFQKAEDIAINGIDERLEAGKSYDLTATVLPVLTINKNVTWVLENGTEGVTLTKEGRLTIAANVTGEITVRATAQSGENVTATRTFTVVAPPDTHSGLFETEMLVGESGEVTAEGTSATFAASGADYLPLNASGDKWYVSLTVQGAAQAEGARAGIMSAAPGYMRYYLFGLRGDLGSARQAEFGDGYKTAFERINYAANGDNTHSFARANEIGLIKDGETYYFLANGKLFAKKTAEFGGDTAPVLYAEGCTVTFSDVSVTTDAAAVDAALAQHKFYVGGHVTKEGDVYTLASADFGSTNTLMNWPPENDYCNGLKNFEALQGDYTIEFTMSAIKPYGTKYDGKVLVYLKSERVTSSLQFVIKGDKNFPAVTFCANLDDNTWTEYTLPAEIDILSGETQVKVVKNNTGVQLWLNGTQVTELTSTTGVTQTADVLMRNNGYWNEKTRCTPGIGSFQCGVTITAPTITAN